MATKRKIYKNVGNDKPLRVYAQPQSFTIDVRNSKLAPFNTNCRVKKATA
ncbi:hypothetical protein [Nostoc sp.]